MWFEILLVFLQPLIYFLIPLIIVYFMYRRGKFKKIGRIRYLLLVGIGVIFPFIDVIQTELAIGYEGNPIVSWYISSLPEGYGWALFILGHLALSVLAFWLGWIGRSEEKIRARAILTFFDVLWVFLITMNFTLMMIYGMI